MKPYPEYRSDVDFCCKLHRSFGKSFYVGTRLLPKEQREAICVLYAFFRLPDEIVDTNLARDKSLARLELQRWKKSWNDYFLGQEISLSGEEEKVFRASKYVFNHFQIPFEYSEAFLDSMLQDTEKSRYESYAQLSGYMYGSAVVVGYMVTFILNQGNDRFFSDSDFRQKVLLGAKALGEAFQLTNFLRDVQEDLVLRDRIYLPLDEIERFGVRESDLVSGKMSEQIKNLVGYQIKRTLLLYQEADRAIGLLLPRSQKPIYIARVLYAEILNKLAEREGDIFSGRVRVSLWRKFQLVLLVFIGRLSLKI